MKEKHLFSCCYGKTKCKLSECGVELSFDNTTVVNPTLKVFSNAISIKDTSDNSCRLIFSQLLDFVEQSDIPVFKMILAKYKWYKDLDTSTKTFDEFFSDIEEKQNKLYNKFVANSDDKICSIYNLVMEIGKEYIKNERRL